MEEHNYVVANLLLFHNVVIMTKALGRSLPMAIHGMKKLQLASPLPNRVHRSFRTLLAEP